MTDIHSHLLPCVDDGSPSLAMTERMLRRYAAQGVTDVICTPHQNRSLSRTDELKEAFNALREWWKGPVKLYLGAEIYYYEEMLRDLTSGRLLTLNGSKYVLVEFSAKYNVADIPESVYELKAAGYTPIVAHIERYAYLSQKDYFAVKENGGLIQINAAAAAGEGCRKAAAFLLRRGLVDFIATDCHNDGDRSPDFTAAKRVVMRKYPRQAHLFGPSPQNVHLQEILGLYQ